uniref:Tektin n=1 Tax=Strigamia maritima TaxID=126957 RepID=T1JH22_STRMM
MTEVCSSSRCNAMQVNEQEEHKPDVIDALYPAPSTTTGKLAVLQTPMPSQGYYPGSYEYKYSAPKWHRVMNNIYQNAIDVRNQAENQRTETNWITTKLIEQTDRNQADATHILRERFQDVIYWKNELQRTIEDVTKQLDLLGTQRDRLDKLLRTTEIPAQINLECSHARDRRQLPDRVDDIVDQSLHRELILIRKIQEFLRKTIAETDDQIRRLRGMKEECEFDWGDKWEAANIDDRNCKLTNNSKDIIMRHGAAVSLPGMSSAEQWATYTRDLINRTETNRAHAVRYYAILDGIIADTSRELRDTADNVDTALDERISEMEEALQKVEHHRDRILTEISQTEKMTSDVKYTLNQLENPLKVNFTRMDNRKYRNGIERCRDFAHTRLLDEHQDLLNTTETMLSRFATSRNQLDTLERTRLDLEKEISVKYKSLFIDRNKCKFARSKYPSYSTLLGY